jgi:hypothetical protein
LDKPCFHDDSGFDDSFMLEEMMERRNREEFPFEIFFPENLQKA